MTITSKYQISKGTSDDMSPFGDRAAEISNFYGSHVGPIYNCANYLKDFFNLNHDKLETSRSGSL